MSQSDQRREIELPAGTIRYREAGEGKPIVFVHGFLVDGRLWDGVVDSLSDRYRCLAPDWPIAAHQVALKADADLSPYGIAAIISNFLEALDLSAVTIVGNDSGGAMSQVLVTRHPERIGRLVLTNCDTHENFPPGIFKTMPPIAKLPGGMSLLSAPFRIDALARAAFKPFTMNPIPADLIASWMKPSLHDPGVRRDAKKVTAGMNKRTRWRRPRSCAAPSCRFCSPGPLATVSFQSSTRSGLLPRPPTRESSRSPTRGPSCHSISRNASPTRSPPSPSNSSRKLRGFSLVAGFSSD